MDTENYISPSKITKQYDITSGTLRRWSEAGKIRCLRPNGGKRIYNIEDIKKIFNKENSENVEIDSTKDTINKLLVQLKNDTNEKDENVSKSLKIIEDELNILSKLF